MTDSNATDELRKLLDELGVSHSDHYWHTSWRSKSGTLHMANEQVNGSLMVDMLTPEQAVAVTLGSTLTAEQIEKAIHDCSTYASYDGCTYYASGMMLQAIADELNAMLGSGTCEVEYVNEWMGWHCKSCDTLWQGLPDQKPNYCQNCGKAVKR